MIVPVKAGKRPVGDWGVPENWRSVPDASQLVPLDGDHFTFDDYLSADQSTEAISIWTPELVQLRLCAAFEVNHRIGGRVGPKFRSGSWPATLVEFADMIDAEARQEAERRSAEVRCRPAAEDIARMEAALSWPLRFLRHDCLQADALLTWAYGQVRPGGVAGILKDRAQKVSERVATIEATMLAERRRIAGGIAAEANAAISAARQAGDRAAAQQVREQARLRFMQAVADAPRQQQTISRKDALPGKVLSRTRLDHHRKRAAATIARGLNHSGEKVW